MRIVAALVVISLVVTGCGASLNQPTETVAQAMNRVDGYLRQTIDATMKSAKFSKTLSSNDSGSACVAGGTDSGFTGQVQAQLGYETTVNSAAPELTALRNYWTGQHYSVDELTNHVDAYLDNGYHLAAAYYPERHKLDLIGISPCVWSNGAPPSR